MKKWKLIAIVTIMVALAACSRTFFIKVSGRVSEGVNFCFYNSRNDRQPSEHTIASLFVQKHAQSSAPSWKASSWKTIWKVEGRFDAECIAYGATSQRYKTLIPAIPLAYGSEYRIVATGNSNPVDGAALIFNIDASGMAVTREKSQYSLTQ